MRSASLLLLSACGLVDGDLSFVALSADPIQLDRAEATIDRYLLEDCDGGSTEIEGPGSIDLLSGTPEAVLLPSGRWCAFGVAFSPDRPLVLGGTTASGTSFEVSSEPGLVLLDQEFVVDHDEWVLVLEGWSALDAAALDARGSVPVPPGDPVAEEVASSLPSALFLGPVWEARDTIYLDLWPFPDIAFGVGVGDVDATGGCNGGGTIDRDRDGDGLFDDDDPDDDGDGLDDGDDPDADGDGVDDGRDPGAGSDGGAGGDGGDGGSAGGGDGCGGGGGGGGGGGCDGGSGGADCSCDLDTCSTIGFAPPISFIVGLVALRRRRGTPESRLPSAG